MVCIAIKYFTRWRRGQIQAVIRNVERFKRLEKKLVLSHSLVSQNRKLGDMSGADNIIVTH